MDCVLWRWLALEVMNLKGSPVQIEGQPQVCCCVGAAAATESLAVLKL